jgi:hypothetical protein
MAGDVMKAMSIFVIGVILLLALVSPIHARDFEDRYSFCLSVSGSYRTYIIDRLNIELIGIDCATDEYVIKIEDAKKWTDAIGPALYTAIVTGKKPGVALIITDKRGEEMYVRLKDLAAKYDIKTWKAYGGALGYFDRKIKERTQYKYPVR